jgi:long-subunit fatty acid transport protein
MKRITLIYIIILSSAIIKGQGFEEALRFSQTFAGGTARHISMGGAFGALGGDISVLSTNPAGIAVFQSGAFSFTPGYNKNLAKTRYQGTNRDEFDYNFGIDNLGLVTAIKSKNNQLINFNFGFGFNRIADFSSNQIFEGINPNSSLVDYFLHQARDRYPQELDPYVEGLAYQGYVIDLDTNALPDLIYYTDMPPANETYQKRITETSGRINEWDFTFGFNYAHTLYIGASLGVRSIHYEENYTHSESDYVYHNELLFDYYRFNTYRGTGYNFKFGFIYKPIQLIRIGGAIHTPTIINFEHDYDANLYSVFASPSDIYPADEYGEYYDVGLNDYRMITPLKVIGSIGLQIKKLLLLSFDYEYTDYSQIRYREDADLNEMDQVNMLLSDYLKPAGNIKTGAEIRLGDFSFRGGFTNYGTPYGKNDYNKDAKHYSISTGMGLRVKSFTFDLAYRYSVREELLRVYDYFDAFVDADYRISKITATIGFRF